MGYVAGAVIFAYFKSFHSDLSIICLGIGYLHFTKEDDFIFWGKLGPLNYLNYVRKNEINSRSYFKC